MAQHDHTLAAQRIPHAHHHNPVRRRKHADGAPLRSGPGHWVIAGVSRGWSAIIVV
jgi:hypothetical protein